METKKAPASRGIVIGLALGAVMGALSGFSELGFVLAPAFLGFVLGSWGYARARFLSPRSALRRILLPE